jgi:hypothetical protein
MPPTFSEDEYFTVSDEGTCPNGSPSCEFDLTHEQALTEKITDLAIERRASTSRLTFRQGRRGHSRPDRRCYGLRCRESDTPPSVAL